jgi:hypothetical protein
VAARAITAATAVVARALAYQSTRDVFRARSQGEQRANQKIKRDTLQLGCIQSASQSRPEMRYSARSMLMILPSMIFTIIGSEPLLCW